MDTFYALTVLTCPACGQQNPDGARFCNACASPLRAEERQRPVSEERKTAHSALAQLQRAGAT